MDFLNDFDVRTQIEMNSTNKESEPTVDVSSEGSSASDKEEKQNEPKGKKRKAVQKSRVSDDGLKSDAWANFTKYKNENGLWRAKCKHCGGDYAADPNRNGTSSLLRHIQRCRNLHEHVKSSDDVLKDMALKMKKKFDKYWGNVEKMNMLLYVAVVIDPRYKMVLIEASFESLYKGVRDEDVPLQLSESEEKPLWERMIELVDESVREIFNGYLKKFGPLFQEKQQNKLSTQRTSTQHKSKMRQKITSKDLGGTSGNGTRKSELDRYLLEEREEDIDGFDILDWWKNNSARFPVLSTMARDVLAIPISTVASESAFSTGGRVLDSFRSSLSPPLVESLICTQDWIRKEREEIKVEEDLEKLDDLAKELCNGFKEDDASCNAGSTI